MSQPTTQPRRNPSLLAGRLRLEDCRLADLLEILRDTTDLADYPTASTVEHGVPAEARLFLSYEPLGVGDRVMQIRNNYDKEVYNGDIGIITQVDVELQKVKVNLDGRAIEYDFLELDELTHAFAMSIHKAQGSEYPAVVIPVLTTHYMMLQRNLLYTAVTRARRLVVLVGQPKAIAMAVHNNKVSERFTGLRERLTRET